MAFNPEYRWRVLGLGVVLALALMSGCGSEGDITSPALTVEEGPTQPTNVTPLTLRGTVEEGATVEVSVTPALTTPVPVDIVDGQWSFVLKLPDSTFTLYSVAVSAVDRRGNRSTALLSFVFDNVAEVTFDQFVSPVLPTTVQTLAGTIEPGAKSLVVAVGGVPIEQEKIFINVNTWRAELPAELPALAEGAVTVTATDALDNVKTESQKVLVSESAIPLDILFESPTNKTAQDVAVDTDAIPADVNVFLARGSADPVEVSRNEETQQYSLTGLLQGKNILTVTATADGFVETTAKVLLFVDQLRPTAAVSRAAEAVQVVFSEAVQGVDATTVVLRDASEAQVPGVVDYDERTRTALFTPDIPLLADMVYRLELLGSTSEEPAGSYIADLAGNPLLPNRADNIWQSSVPLPAPSED